MVSTLYLLEFFAFYAWQITSKSVKPDAALKSPLMGIVLSNAKLLRSIGAIVLLIAIVGFTFSMGIMSGIFAAIVGLMGVGCLSVIISPFRYLQLTSIIALYFICVLLELFI